MNNPPPLASACRLRGAARLRPTPAGPPGNRPRRPRARSPLLPLLPSTAGGHRVTYASPTHRGLVISDTADTRRFPRPATGQSWTSPAWPCVWRPSAAAFAAAHAADRPPREGRWRACPSALHPLYSTPRTHIPHSGTRRIRLHSTNCRCVLIRNSSIQPSVAVSCDRPLRYHSAGSCHIRSVTAWARPSSHKADAVIFHHIHGANVAHVWAAVP